MAVPAKLLLVSALAVAACDPFGPDVRAYRDVAWHLDAVDGRGSAEGPFPVEFGAYTTEDSLDCQLTGGIVHQFGPAWVEDPSSGRVLRVGVTYRSGEPYDLLTIIVQAVCGGAMVPDWWLHMSIEAVVMPDKARGKLTIGPLALHYGSINNVPVTDDEISRWFRVSLMPGALAPTMDVRFDLTIIVHHLEPGEPSPVVAEVSRSFTLTYRRHEEINERSSP